MILGGAGEKKQIVRDMFHAIATTVSNGITLRNPRCIPYDCAIMRFSPDANIL